MRTVGAWICDRPPEPRKRLAGVGISAAMLSVVLAIAALARPAGAQDGWQPTVATAPGGTLYVPPQGPAGLTPPGHVGLTPPAIDPRFFPSPHSSAPSPTARRILPSETSVPLETGALPVPPVRPAGAHVPRVEKREALSPIRPLQPQPIAAEAQAVDNEAEAGGEAKDAAQSIFKKPGPLDAPPPDATAAQQYCFNSVESASDARFAWQAKKIQEMEAELDKRSQQLEAKTQEYKRWLARRDDFSRKAHEKLVGFYTQMRPDAAALQLENLDEDMAAAVVTKLNSKVAGQIMGEMNPERAAKIAAIISGAARVPPERRRPAPPTPPAEDEQAAVPPSPDAAPPAEEPRS